MSTTFHGVHKGLALFSSGTHAVLINTSNYDVFDIKTLDEFDQDLFSDKEASIANLGVLADLAEEALPESQGDVTVIASAKQRTYRVPKAVQENAQYALSQVRRAKSYGDPVAMFSARSLARGGSIPLSQVKNLARFFALAATRDSEEELSAEEKLAWELFGGDAARRWSMSIVSLKSQSSSLVAAAAADPSKDDTESPAEDSTETDESDDMPPEGSVVDPNAPHVFFSIAGLDEVCVYCSRGEEDELHVGFDELPEGHPQLEDYEEFVDDEDKPVTAGVIVYHDPQQDVHYPPADLHDFYGERTETDPMVLVKVYAVDFDDSWKTFDGEARQWHECARPKPDADLVSVDADTAHAMIAHQATNNELFDIRDAYPEESTLFEMADDAINDELMLFSTDYEQFAEMYTPQERSQNASRQVRDRNGRFARSGTTVSTSDNRKGRVVGYDAGRQKVEVKMDDSNRSEFWDEKQIQISRPTAIPKTSEGTQAKARLKTSNVPLTPDELAQKISEYEALIKKERERPADATFEALDPTTSDVKPLYIAIVDKLDPTAVLDLVALAPKSKESNEVAAFRREDKQWKEDSNLLLQLKSVTPPSVVTLDEATYQDVVRQVDAWTADPQPPAPEATPPTADALPEQAAADMDINHLLPSMGEYGETITLAYEGGFDRNRGNAERLRHYWLYGPGAAKIVWNTPGDWTRCVANLAKYLGPRAKGYCSLRHKEATGLWTGDRLHRMRGFSDDGEDDLMTSEEVITASLTRASLVASMHDGMVPESINDVADGTPFTVPILVPIGVETGDKRKFAPDSLSTREFPLPLMWQIKTGAAHDGSVIVGRIDGCELTEDGLVNAYGVLDTGVYAKEAERLIRGKFLRGVSADLDQFEATADMEALTGKEGTTISADDVTITSARLSGATLVPKPAFQEVEILLHDQSEELMPIQDGEYVEAPDEADVQPLLAAALIASGIPVQPPSSWFEDPKLKEPTPLTIDPNGRVFGHIAAWHVDHIGLPFSTKPPRSRTNYAYFHTGTLTCDDDTNVSVGQLTLAGGHASLQANAAEAVRHYDDTASAVADVHAGEDEHGIWVAGALRPNVTPEQIRVLRASAPSGDWRPINGRLEMVAVCQVNVPGYPVTRARVASGHMYALVAAGASVLAKMRTTPWDEGDSELESRLALVEANQRAQLAQARDAVLERVKPIRDEHQEALVAAATAAIEKVSALMPTEEEAFADVTEERRKALAKKGQALPDGSYPIPDVEHLMKAIQAYGRANPEDRSKVRRHIMKRARGLGRTDLIPEKWTSMSADEKFQDARSQFISIRDSELLAELEDARSRFASLASSDITDRTRRMISRNPDFDEAAHPRDSTGRFRDVIAKLRDNLAKTPEAAEAVAQLDDAAKAEAEKNFEKAKLAADRAIHILDAAAQGARDIGAAETMRDAAKQLGRVIAFLPVPVGEQHVVASYEQLAPEVQTLIEELVARAEKVEDPSDDAKKDLADIKSFISGGDQWNQEQLNAALSRIVRMLL